MASDTLITSYRENVFQVVHMVFETMLGLDVHPFSSPWVLPQDLLTAAVYFVGSWQGAVLLECTREQARTFAQLFLSTAASTAVDDDVRDALGELANMIAGNLKSVLPGGILLSMPSVIEGTDYSLQICGNRRVERVPFWSAGHVFGLTIVEIRGVEEADRSQLLMAGA